MYYLLIINTFWIIDVIKTCLLLIEIKYIFLFSALGAAALNDRLYVCGGFDGVSSLNIVECYQPDLDRWTIITPMQKHRSAGGVVAFDGYIYILGGHDGLSIFDSVSW